MTRNNAEYREGTYHVVTGPLLLALVASGVMLSLVAALGHPEAVGYAAGPILALIAAILSLDRFEVFQRE